MNISLSKFPNTDHKMHRGYCQERGRWCRGELITETGQPPKINEYGNIFPVDPSTVEPIYL